MRKYLGILTVVLMTEPVRADWPTPIQGPIRGAVPFYQPLVPTQYPPVVRPTIPTSRRDLERHIERTIKWQLGRCVDDVDVDVDFRCRRVEVEVELRHPAAYRQLQQLLYSMPELSGFQIRIDVDWER